VVEFMARGGSLWRVVDFIPSGDSLSQDKISRCNDQLMGIFSRGDIVEDVVGQIANAFLVETLLLRLGSQSQIFLA
jgi:hypothetical protein